jgi:hypothetical protein
MSFNSFADYEVSDAGGVAWFRVGLALALEHDSMSPV